MHVLLRTPAVFLSLLAIGGCSSGTATDLLPQIGQKAPDRYRPGEAYQLSAEELKLDCKRLTGRMQVRILQIRDTSERGNGNMIARGLQSTLTPVLGGTTYGVDRQADFARDKAVLEAMNRQLATKNCATFDLEAELRPRPLRDTPTPVPKGEAKASSPPSAPVR